MLKINEINNVKHIVIVLENNASVDKLASANALYTYLLQLHKKVSLYCAKSDYGINLSFLPWMDKLKNSYPTSSDYEIDAISSIDLFEYFMLHDIKLNSKMATSLYAGLIDVTNSFKSVADGMVFAMAKLLVESDADVKSCNENLINYQTYATLRLKAILLSKMVLKNDAKIAIFELVDEDLIKSGAKLENAKVVLNEALGLPSVESAVIIYKNKEIMREGI